LFGLRLPAFGQVSVTQANLEGRSVLELTLDDTVKLAVENNLNLQKQKIDLGASRFSERNMWSEIFPSISANAGVGYRNALFSGSEPNNSGLNYSVGLGISLGFNAGIPFAMKSIKLAHQANLLKYEDAVNQLSIQVTKKFYSLVAEKNNLLLLEEIQNLAQRQFARSEISFRNGLVGELSLLNSRLALENARYNLIAARTASQNNTAEFFAMLGMTPNADVTLSGEVNVVRVEVDSETLINDHLHKRPDIARNMQEIERLKNERLQSVLQNQAPSLNLSFEWGSSNFDPFNDNFNASARLNIPIDPWIPGTSKSQAVRRALNAIDKAKLDLAMAEDSAKTQIRSLAALLHNSWDGILIARLSLDAARRSYQLTEQGFNSGTVEALTLEDVRNNLANARQRLMQAELSYFNMVLDLSAALNIDWKNLIQNFGVLSE